MSRVWLAALVLIFVPRLTYGQADDPYGKLAFFEGNWTVQGQEATYRETCSWFENRRFMMCKAEDKETSTPDWSLSVFGYSAEKQAYTHTLLGSSGAVRGIAGWFDGKVWTFTGETYAGGNTKRSQITIRPTAEGFVFRQDVSTNGASWEQGTEFTYVRLP